MTTKKQLRRKIETLECIVKHLHKETNDIAQLEYRLSNLKRSKLASSMTGQEATGDSGVIDTLVALGSEVREEQDAIAEVDQDWEEAYERNLYESEQHWLSRQ